MGHIIYLLMAGEATDSNMDDIWNINVKCSVVFMDALNFTAPSYRTAARERYEPLRVG
jgi:hypothetical protein